MTKLTAATLALTVCVAGVASAAADHSTPGTPGTANCKGQSIAYLAQAFKNGVIDEAIHGIGGVAKASEVTNQELMDIVDAFCSGV